MDALFFTCIGVIVVIVMLLEFPGETKSKSGERKDERRFRV
jgi:hypothetical protein